MRRAVSALCALLVMATAGVAMAQAPGNDGHGHDYRPPPPESLGGALSLRTLDGKPFGLNDLKGSWSIVYFGYSRCATACPIGLATVAETVTRLRTQGVPLKATFVDFEWPPEPEPVLRRPEARAQAEALRAKHASTHKQSSSHAHYEKAVRAQQNVAGKFSDRITVLTGSRAQMAAAVTAFKVRREHKPPRAGETDHSINHTTFIYVLNPEAKVVGYVYHDARPDELVGFVRKRMSAQQRAGGAAR
jgi:cytochrome oxidase Cu insertion factor (SCO1/SenC/PrrC family)